MTNTYLRKSKFTLADDSGQLWEGLHCKVVLLVRICGLRWNGMFTELVVR